MKFLYWKWIYLKKLEYIIKITHESVICIIYIIDFFILIIRIIIKLEFHKLIFNVYASDGKMTTYNYNYNLNSLMEITVWIVKYINAIWV